jgi:hypothetical protein
LCRQREFRCRDTSSLSKRSTAEINDQKGTLLKNDADAVALAEGIIQKIKREKIKTKDDLGTILGLAITVTREGYGAILTIPFFPGSA